MTEITQWPARLGETLGDNWVGIIRNVQVGCMTENLIEVQVWVSWLLMNWMLIFMGGRGDLFSGTISVIHAEAKLAYLFNEALVH